MEHKPASNSLLLAQLLQIVQTLRPYEKIEIKLDNNELGKISFTRTSTLKTVIFLDSQDI